MRLRQMALWTIALIVSTRAAISQELRGTVRDSSSRQGIPGAVLMLLDSSGAVLARNITNERGEYRVVLSGEMRTIRFVRIGYRPHELSLSDTRTPDARLDATMTPIPTFLAPVRVTVNAKCPRRPDRDAAFALYEQARAGLLATVVAREANPADLVRLRYDRTRDGPDLADPIVRQQVRLDSTARVTTSFEAAHSARDFVRLGFMQVSGDTGEFYGPDADALLDDAFVEGYCFRIADSDRSRPSEVGLAFTPAERRRQRIDIDGVLWIDTVRRALRDIDYKYLGLDARATRLVHPGGSVSFAEMPNGDVLIDRWAIRMPQMVADSLGRRHGPFVPYTVTVREVGGEVARADWPDGTAWVSTLGALRLRILDREGEPARHMAVRLTGTDYHGVSDSLGDVEIRHLLPGPYAVALIDSSLATMDVVFGTPVRFQARRDSLIRATVTAPSVDEFAAERCGSKEQSLPATAPAAGDPAWLLALVVASDSKPVTNANWELRRQAGASWVVLASGHGTRRKGVDQYCWPATVGDTLELRVWRDGEAPASAFTQIARRSTLLRLNLPRP